MHARLLALLALLARTCDAHVAMVFKATYPGPIRNANSPTGNGAASVAGACGGQNTFGANGKGQLTDGSTVTLTINYAAGHRSANNVFRFAYSCTDTSQNGLSSAESVLSAAAPNNCKGFSEGAETPYPVPAPDAIVEGGYEITCTLPLRGNTETEECTMSLLDQRDWGGCVDVDLLPAAASLPPSPPPAPYVSNEGKYYLVSDNSIDSSASTFSNCDFSEGYLEVPPHAEGAASFQAKLDAQAEGCRTSPAITAPATATIRVQTAFTMTLADGKYSGEVLIGEAQQPYTFAVAGQAVEWAYYNPARPEEQPIINDGFSNSEVQGISVGGSLSSGSSNTGAIAAVIIILLLIALGAAAYVWYRKRQAAQPGQKAPTYTGGAMYGSTPGVPPPPPPPPGGFQPLPPGWMEMKDPNSGQIYYHNAAMQITQWERPGGGPVGGRV